MGPPKIQVKVRPQAHEGPKSASRLYVSREAFLQLAGNLDATTLCIVEKVVTAPAVTGSSAEGATSGGAWLVPAGAHGEFVIGPGSATPQPVARREATLWTQEKLGRGVVQMSRAFQSAMGLSIGDTVQITLPSPPTAPPEAVEVVLRETTDADGCEHLRAADAKDGDPLVLKARQRTLRNWEGYLDAQLGQSPAFLCASYVMMTEC